MESERRTGFLMQANCSERSSLAKNIAYLRGSLCVIDCHVAFLLLFLWAISGQFSSFFFFSLVDLEQHRTETNQWKIDNEANHKSNCVSILFVLTLSNAHDGHVTGTVTAHSGARISGLTQRPLLSSCKHFIMFPSVNR